MTNEDKAIEAWLDMHNTKYLSRGRNSALAGGALGGGLGALAAFLLKKSMPIGALIGGGVGLPVGMGIAAKTLTKDDEMEYLKKREIYNKLQKYMPE